MKPIIFTYKTFVLIMLTAFIISAASTDSLGGNGKKKNSPSKQTELWRQVEKTDASRQKSGVFGSKPEYRVYEVNQAALKTILAAAPLESSDGARTNSIVLEIPTPDGSIARFRIEESPLFAPEVAKQFPTWKTFVGTGIDDPSATAGFDINENGFHGYVMSAKGTFLIDPFSATDKNNYIVYYKGAFGGAQDRFFCEVKNNLESNVNFRILSAPTAFSNGTIRRTYRLAVSATKEYTNFFNGSQTSAFAAVQSTFNRLNVVYRRELAVSFTLVSDTRTIFTNANNGNFPDASSEKVAEDSLKRSPVVLDTTYGKANYDIGHVLSRTGNPNGLASSPSLCDNDSTSQTDPALTNKAQGFTGAPTPTGDGFDVDYVAHEIGHQFGMSHTFNNDVDGSCTTRAIDSAYEPASGITIMSYAGICAPRNLAANSIEFFNLRSFDQALNYLTMTADADQACGTKAPTGNTPPTVAANGTSFNIPKQTPFILTASGTDADNDSLTYSWEEFDLNANGATGSVPNPAPSPSPTPGGNPPRNDTAVDTDEDGKERPIFRAYPPTVSGSRTFPSLYYILNNANVPPLTYTGTLPFAPTVNAIAGYVCAAGETCVTGERLPSISRTMTFRVTARDNRANGGGVADAQMQVVVNGAAGPFRVATQNTATAWQGNSVQTITWEVANTNVAPISASLVNVLLSTDGGQTFPITLSQNTPNDGSEQITIPNITAASARIKIEAVGNIFFDINNVNFTINAAANTTRTPFDFDGDGRTDISVFRPSNGTWFLSRSANGFTAVQFGESNDLIAPADFDGDGKTDISVFRPSNGTWYRINSLTNTFSGIQFGQNGDLPRPADFDGDNRADISVFRPSNGTWYRLNSSNGQFVPNQFGANGDIPVPADYDGDGRANLAVFRPTTNQWYIAKATGVPAQSFDVVNFGAADDIPVPANYDGDTKIDVAVFRPSNGVWYRINSSNGQTVAFPFGQSGDVPAPGDYDGDGRADFAVFRASNGTWYVSNSQSGSLNTRFGVANDRPIPAAFNR